MTITSEEVALLDDDDVQNIQTNYDLVMESEHGTGNHLLLMSCLSGHGFMQMEQTKLLKWQRKLLH